MKDKRKTKEQLVSELTEMRQRVAELEALEIERDRAYEALAKSGTANPGSKTDYGAWKKVAPPPSLMSRITDAQKEGLRKAAGETEEELARDVAELQAKARKKLISRLNRDQRKRLTGIVGGDFDYREIDRRGKSREGAGPTKQK